MRDCKTPIHGNHNSSKNPRGQHRWSKRAWTVIATGRGGKKALYGSETGAVCPSRLVARRVRDAIKAVDPAYKPRVVRARVTVEVAY